MNEVKKYAIGIDIGGTNTVFGFVDSRGVLHAEGSVSTFDYAEAAGFVEALHEAIEAVRRGLGEHELAGIGIGAPNANYYKGIIDNAANLPWKGVIPLAQMLGRFYPGLKVVLTNDANAAAVGEMTYGGARGMSDFILITLGTGLGSGFVANGNIIYGHDSYAGEFGHIIAVPGGRECGCGRRGCLETYVSAPGLKRTAFEVMAIRRHPSELRDVSFNDLSAKAIADAARKGDPVALEVFERTGEMLGKALADAVAITSPEAIFLFGGVTRAGDMIFDPIRKSMEENLLANYRNKIKLLPSELMDTNAAVLGASSLAWHESYK